MGYYVYMTNYNAKIRKSDLGAAYEALCALNSHDELKRGGAFGHPSGVDKPEGSRSVSNSPHRWFSWMDWNYDETCETLEEVLCMLGFHVETDQEGNINIIHYETKAGQEELFFRALAPWVVSSWGEDETAFIEWYSDNGDEYRWEFTDGEMKKFVVEKKWVPVN